MIYLYDDMEHVPAELIRETFPLMPVERQQRAMRYRNDIDMNLCVIAYWLLLHGLQREYGITEPPAFTYGENGKPYLSNHPDIHFNISHCKAGVVCAISDTKVGVDIQDVRLFDIEVARRVCTHWELEQLNQCQHLERLFCTWWTIKESFIKLHGGSIAQSLNQIDATSTFEQMNGVSHLGGGYHITAFCGSNNFGTTCPEVNAIKNITFNK